MARVLAKSSRNDFEAFALPSVRGRLAARKHGGEQARHQPQGTLEACGFQQKAADKKARTFHRVLGAGEPRDPFEELARAAFGRSLDGRFRGRLGDVLGDAGYALRPHNPCDRERGTPMRIERREQHEARDLQRDARHEHARDAEPRREPAAAEIGENAGRLVEQEQQ